MAKVRIGIIGAGNIAKTHSTFYTNNPHAEITAYCDIVPEKAEALASRFGGTAYPDMTSMFKSEQLDAVSVCVPNAVHKPAALAGLKNDCHVLCEKPMALDARQGKQMAEAAGKSGKVFMMGMPYRFRPETAHLKNLLESGAFGEVYHITVSLYRRRGIPGLGRWFTTKAESGGGPLIDIGVHIMDLVMYLAGFPKPKSVSATTYAKFGPLMEGYHYVGMWAGPPDYKGVFDVEDFASALFRFDGLTINMETCWAANVEVPEPMSVTIFGDKMGARMVPGRPPRLFGEQEGIITDFAPNTKDGDHFQAEGDHFIDCILNKKTPLATAEQGVMLMKLLDATYKSAAAGKEVPIR